MDGEPLAFLTVSDIGLLHAVSPAHHDALLELGFIPPEGYPPPATDNVWTSDEESEEKEEVEEEGVDT